MKWRRFELTTDNSEQISLLENLLDEKGITQKELALILFSLRVRPEFGRSDFDI